MGTVLDQEMAFYRQREKEYLQHYNNMYVVISSNRLIGAYSTETEAYEAGLGEIGNVPFLIKRVTEEPEQVHLPALSVGILNADLQ